MKVSNWTGSGLDIVLVAVASPVVGISLAVFATRFPELSDDSAFNHAISSKPALAPAQKTNVRDLS